MVHRESLCVVNNVVKKVVNKFHGGIRLQKKKKRVVLLATGGTIAGTAEDARQTTGYRAGALGVGDAAPRGAGAFRGGRGAGRADRRHRQQGHGGGRPAPAGAACAGGPGGDPETDGVVITHGTDTMEETAYFLQLTLKTEKPVVLTGAMRPATALSADGPMNLLEAVQLAADREARGLGVLVVMDDEIHSARDVEKVHTASLAALASPPFGPLGIFAGGRPRLYRAPLRRHTAASPLFLPEPSLPLPRVDILYTHADEDGALVEAAVRAGAQGLVYAGSGMGSISAGAEPALLLAARQGIAVVRASRTRAGAVVPSLPQWEQAGFVSGDTLTPEKARILLQLALLRTRDPQEIQRLFDQL
jgi:L-asparaginase